MTPESFLAEVAQPNMAAALTDSDDVRLIVNAILSLDALAGIIHAHGKAAGRPGIAECERDDDYREALAHSSRSFRTLRDTAASIKHGELTGQRKKLLARLLRGPDAMRVVPNTLGLFQFGDRLGSSVVVIELLSDLEQENDPRKVGYVRASSVIADTFRMLKRIVEGEPARTDEHDRGTFLSDDAD